MLSCEENSPHANGPSEYLVSIYRVFYILILYPKCLNINLIFKFLQPAGGSFIHVISLCFIKSYNEKS